MELPQGFSGMATQLTLKSNPVTPGREGERLLTCDNLSLSAPPFEGAEFREARIYSFPGDVVKVELLFVCEKAPSKDDLFIAGRFCRYNNPRVGVIAADSSAGTWNGIYRAPVGWHWVTVLCWMSDFSIWMLSGGMHCFRDPREDKAFDDYHSADTRKRDVLSSAKA